MTPIATIYQQPDGSFGIMSTVPEPADLAHVLALLLPNLIAQAKARASAAPAALVSVPADAPLPLLTTPDLCVHMESSRCPDGRCEDCGAMAGVVDAEPAA